MSSAEETDELLHAHAKSLIAEADELAAQLNYREAARKAGAAVAFAEECAANEVVTVRPEGSQLIADNKWVIRLSNFAPVAAAFYSDVADSEKGGQIAGHLIAAAYYEQAATAAFYGGMRRQAAGYRNKAAECQERFDDLLDAIPAGAREELIIARVQMRLRLKDVNRVDFWRNALWGGQSQDFAEQTPTGGQDKNCYRLAPAMVATLHGAPTVAGDSGEDARDEAGAIEVYQWAYARQFEEVTLDQAAERLRSLGEGATGILQVVGTDASHVAAVANVDGAPLRFDGHANEIHVLQASSPHEDDNTEYRLLITHDSADELPRIVERQRASEILKRLP